MLIAATSSVPLMERQQSRNVCRVIKFIFLPVDKLSSCYYRPSVEQNFHKMKVNHRREEKVEDQKELIYMITDEKLTYFLCF